MRGYLYTSHHDLITPDGKISKMTFLNEQEAEALVVIESISSLFLGFEIPEQMLQFNFKSTLAQLGLNGQGLEYHLEKARGRVEVKIRITAFGPLAKKVLLLLKPGSYVGKLFAADERRQVRSPDYFKRMFNRFDRDGQPLLFFGSHHKEEKILFETKEGRAIAHIALNPGKRLYMESIFGFLPTVESSLEKNMPLREFLKLHQWVDHEEKRTVSENKMLLVATPPLHIRPFFARVAKDLLPSGFFHTDANVLEPTTTASGDVYEFYGKAQEEITHIPLEFFTLEPHREYVFFSDRDQLKQELENPEAIFNTFRTAPNKGNTKAAVFIVKGSELKRLKSSDWLVREAPMAFFPDVADAKKYTSLLENYIQKQPCHPFLQAMETNLITSQGVLFTQYLPSPLMKSMLLSFYVRHILKRIYFSIPSRSYGYYFSQEDRAMLHDLYSFGMGIYWADMTSQMVLRYVQRPGKSSGMFLPTEHVDLFVKAVFFGIYGSNLLEGNFQSELKKLLQGILELKEQINHPLLNKERPLALVTGGGPGTMAVSNRMAKELNILSCAHVVDFRKGSDDIINEQRQNPYVEAKMTYRLDQLIERQAFFYLDFPIFVEGGIGTDFEFSLEELRHKVGLIAVRPIILFGKPEYWKEKITHRYQCNLKHGTIKGSEWLSNALFCVETAAQGLKIYRAFFEGKLPIGKQFPHNDLGFVIVI